MPMRSSGCLCCLLLLWGCAKGSTSDPDGDSPRDLRTNDVLDARSPDLPPVPDVFPDPADLARDGTVSPDIQQPTDTQPADVQLPVDVVPPDTQPPPDVQPADTVAPPTDLCGPCGTGMKCSSSGCVCDPATCAGCCASDGSACHPGNVPALCGNSGATCQPCQTSDPCKLALCGSGQCTITANTNPPYPCPGAYGSPCGGSTGQNCLNGAPCATFVSGQTGFCSRYCSSNSDCSSNKPSGSSPGCNLTTTSNKLCGFECFPGTCPSTLSCDYSEGLCKP